MNFADKSYIEQRRTPNLTDQIVSDLYRTAIRFILRMWSVADFTKTLHELLGLFNCLYRELCHSEIASGSGSLQ